MSTSTPRIRTATIGSFPLPDWLVAAPSEQAVTDATRVVLDLQRQAGIDLPTDGELYRFDVSHPDTNGMIEYFICGFWMLKRSVADRKIEALVKGRDRYLGIR
jgi:5-methyltetrahydropteroyltriglutamate--homocysteine methyltransferase